MSHWPLGIYRSSGSVQASTEILYLPTPQEPLPAAAEIDGQLYAIEADHLHTPWRLSNAQGQGVWQWITSGFGEVPASHAGNGFVLEGEGQGADPGQVHDTETGLHYDHHRYYDPYLTVGYAEADPIGLNGGWNRFSYVDGDPLGAVDPAGLDATNWSNTEGGRSRWHGPTNGNWGGKCWSGGQYSCGGNGPGSAPPTDSADACYQRHDNCYIRCRADKERITACDQVLVRELQELPETQEIDPSPPDEAQKEIVIVIATMQLGILDNSYAKIYFLVGICFYANNIIGSAFK